METLLFPEDTVDTDRSPDEAEFFRTVAYMEEMKAKGLVVTYLVTPRKPGEPEPDTSVQITPPRMAE